MNRQEREVREEKPKKIFALLAGFAVKNFVTLRVLRG